MNYKLYSYIKYQINKKQMYKKWLNIKYHKYNPYMFIRYYLYYYLKDLIKNK